nr:glycosyltransferase family 2 protein [Actinoplanes brasiliensis]
MTDVVLPCRNEAPALPALLTRMPPGYRAIVVDNGSTDGTAGVAREHGAAVVTVTEPGYGAAVHAGVTAADPADGVVCVMDADGSFDPGQLPLLADPVRSGRADLATARRRPVARGSGRCTRGPGTWCWPGACDTVRDCACTTSGRCGPYTGKPCSAWVCATGVSATRWSCCSPPGRPGGV